MTYTKAAVLFGVLLTIAIPQAFADEKAETPAYAQPLTNRKPADLGGGADPVYDHPSWETKYIRNKDGKDGARINIYYDPMSTYSRMVTNNTTLAQNFGYNTVTGGMAGLQAMWSVWAPSDFEFHTGIDWMFPVDVQDQQTNFGGFTVNGQNLNVMGLKLLQVGYRFYMGDFNVVPYGGVGVYYGRNQTTLMSGNQTDLVNYTKLMVQYSGGFRAEYNFTRQRSIVFGLGAEFFVPTKLTDQVSQSGAVEVLPGTEPYLQANMDFMTGIGCRIYGTLAGYF